MGASAAGVREGVRSEAHRRYARPPASRCRDRAPHVGPSAKKTPAASSEIEIARSRGRRQQGEVHSRHLLSGMKSFIEFRGSFSSPVQYPPLQLAVRKFVGLTPPAPSLIRVC